MVTMFRAKHKSRRHVVGLYVLVALLVGGLWRLSGWFVASPDREAGGGGGMEADVYISGPQQTRAFIDYAYYLLLFSAT